MANGQGPMDGGTRLILVAVVLGSCFVLILLQQWIKLDTGLVGKFVDGSLLLGTVLITGISATKGVSVWASTKTPRSVAPPEPTVPPATPGTAPGD